MLFDSTSGEALQVNSCMSDIYGCSTGSKLDDIFGYNQDCTILMKAAELGPNQSWTGRVHPKESRYGVASTEIMLQRDPNHPSCIWLYTLEHPKVDNQVRFSSRSELKMLRVILDNTLDYVFFRDVEGHFILTNRSFRDAAAYDSIFPDIENTISSFVCDASAKWIQDLDDCVHRSGQPEINQVAKVTFINGKNQWLQLTTVPVRNGENETIGFLSVARDISDLKRTEADLLTAIDRANEANKARGEFLAAMSHEIRTPINGVIGASELCQETALNGEQKGYMDTVIQCSNTLLTLVNDILDFSKIEAGQLNLEILTFSPLKVMEDVASEISSIARNKGLELIVASEDSVPEFLLGDSTRLKQVLYNLLGNAVKFTEDGEIIVRAGLLKQTDHEAKIRFTVEDTGIGIEASRRDAIFDSFTQADMSTSRKYGGTGLGLAICRELVTLMQGHISVSSEVGIGTCFTFDLPFEKTDVIGSKAVGNQSKLAGLRVLIVDDNAINRDIYEQMCERWEFLTTVAPDGISALNLLEKSAKDGEPFELMLLDQQMPGLTGLDLAALVQSRSSIRKTKIILLSSSLDHTESTRAVELGIARSLSKPVKRETLLEVILETFEVEHTLEEEIEPQIEISMGAHSLNILLAEDNPVNQKIACRRLEKLGHFVTVAGDGKKALQSVQDNNFDAILMDIEMPGMDGYETTEAIRAYEKSNGLDRHHIIAMTAHALKGDREQCLASGMDDYLSKPFRSETLKDVLSRIRERAQSGAEQLVSNEEQQEEVESSVSEFLEKMDPDDREDLLIAIPAFMEAMPEEIALLRKALKSEDYQSFTFTSHSLKGVLGLFGDNSAMKMAAAMEQIAKSSPDAEDLSQRIDELEESVNKLLNELKLHQIDEPE